MFHNSLQFITQCSQFRSICDSTCSPNCEGYPHIDPTVVNYVKTTLESKKVNLQHVRGFALVMEAIEFVMSYLGPSLLHRLTAGTGDIEDIDLNADYSDDDKEIYFNENDLKEYLQHIEEDNLFKINLLQDDEQTCEQLKIHATSAITEKQQEIEQQKESIKLLQEKLHELKKKNSYYLSGRDGHVQ